MSLSNTHDCSVCDRSFGKQDHLTRHMRIHTRERPYPCPSCPKSFSRRDALHRHIAAHKERDNVEPSLPHSRACVQCATDRVRCSRGQPCRRCSHRGSECLYPSGRQTRGTSSPNPSETESPRVFDGSSLHIDGIDHDDNGESTVPGFGVALEEPSTAAWTWAANAGYSGALDNVGQPGLGVSDINWLSPEYREPEDLNAFLRNLGNITGNSLGEWAGATALAAPALETPTTLQIAPRADINNLSAGPDTWTASSTCSPDTLKNRYYVDGSGARAPFGGRCQDSNGTHETAQSDETESSALHGALDPDSLVPSEAYQVLLEGIASEGRNCIMDIDLSHFPTHGQTSAFVRHYFARFHPIFPFLRRSSFAADASKCWLLLLAVVTVGSKIMDRSQGLPLHDSLPRLLSAIFSRSKYGLEHTRVEDESSAYVPGRQRPRSVTPSLHILQAGVLNVSCLLHSGKKASVERAFVERHFLVEGCHALDLLGHSDGSIGLEDTTRLGNDQIADLWLVSESRVRTGMMIWNLDAMFVYEFQAKPLIQLHHIDATLPCHEDMWELQTSTGQSKRRSPDMKLAEALEMLYVEKRLPPDLGTFATGLLITAICQYTRDILARDRISLTSWTPTAVPQQQSGVLRVRQEWLPRTQTASKWRNSACDCLDILHWPANSNVARRRGFEDHTILQLHLARLLILIPIDSLQVFASGSKPNESVFHNPTHQDSDFTSARLKVLQWAIQDHCKARLALVHCGAIFWHVRRYSCGSILEPYAVYIATLILWAFCGFMKLPGAIEAIDNGFHEQPEPSFLHLDRPLDDELVQTYVQVGHKMSAYMANVGSLQDPGAPGRIAKEGMSLLIKKDQLWGIEQSYASLLNSLVDKS